jgi:hypothetical protein
MIQVDRLSGYSKPRKRSRLRMAVAGAWFSSTWAIESIPGMATET